MGDVKRHQAVHLGGDVFGRTVVVDRSIGARRVVRLLLVVPMDQRHPGLASELISTLDERLISGKQAVQFLHVARGKPAIAPDKREDGPVLRPRQGPTSTGRNANR